MAVNDPELIDPTSATWKKIDPKSDDNQEGAGIGRFGGWTQFLQLITMAYNTAPLPQSTLTPYELVFGKPYRWTTDIPLLQDPEGLAPLPVTVVEYWRQRVRYMQAVFDSVNGGHQFLIGKNRLRYDAHQWYFELSPGELVIVRIPNRSGKLSLQFYGPYKVLRRDDEYSPQGLIYILEHCHSKKTIRAHVQRIRRFHVRDRFLDAPLPESASTGMEVDDPTLSDSTEHSAGDIGDDAAVLDEHSPYSFHGVGKLKQDSMIALRCGESGSLYVARILKVFSTLSGNRAQLHFFMHTTRGRKYNHHKPLKERELAPEYTYWERKVEYHHGTFKPTSKMTPVTDRVSLDEYEVLACNFVLNKENRIPPAVLKFIQMRHGVE